MKKILIVAAAAGLMSLAACKTETNNTTTVETNVESTSDNLTDVSENSTNEMAPTTNASNAL